MTDLTTVGKSVTRIDALEKVTGKARFSADYKMAGMLCAKLVSSPYAHARILGIDTSEAEQLPGVRAVVVPQDAPDRRMGYAIHDEFALPRDNVVRCIGQPVAVVVADTLDIAEQAVPMVRVDYEEVPAVFNAEEALLPNPPAIVHPEMKDGFFSSRGKVAFDPNMPNCVNHFKVRRGDVDRGFEQSDLVLENRYSTARIAHCPLEPHIADGWVEMDGTLTVRMSVQTPSIVHNNLATLFNVSPSRVRVITPYLGGGFGSKVGDDMLQAPLVLLAAMKTGRPVRLVNNREEEFAASRHRPDNIVYIKDGVKKDGTLVAREIKVILNLGRHASIGFVLTRNSFFGAAGAYRIPNFKWDSYGVYTNNPLTGAFRGFGSPEVVWAIEQQMDMLAEKLGIDALAIRKKNMLSEGEVDVGGQKVVASGLSHCLDSAARWIDWDYKPGPEGVWRKGKGLGIGGKYSTPLPSGATVKVHRDGAVEVRHGNVEVGQGLHTVLAQIAAEEFGIPLSMVKVLHNDSAVCPFDAGCVSSRSTFFTGNAVRVACQDAKRKLCDMAAAKLVVDAEKLDVRGGKIFIRDESDKCVTIGELFIFQTIPFNGGEIVGTGSCHIATSPQDPETGQSERSVAYFSYFAHAVEVAVNMETGQVKVLKITTAADGGTPVNPKMIEGQIEGGFLLGIGTSIYEHVILQNGEVMNPNFADYKIPTAQEMPLNKNVKAIIESVPHPEGPYGAKGVGEGPLIAIAPAIGNAVYNAIGVRIKDLPITGDKVLKALREKWHQ